MDLAEFHKYHFRVTRVAAHLLGGPQPAADSSASSAASSAGSSSVRASPVAAAVQDLSKDAAWAAEPWGDRHAELKHVRVVVRCGWGQSRAPEKQMQKQCTGHSFYSNKKEVDN
jgi:hypothetical protein